jgi:hypothetical protein
MAIFDQSQDATGRELHRITTLYPPPDYVKSASHDNICGGAAKLPAHIYGDPRHCTYPCHTAAATWMSAAFLGDKRASHTEDDAEMIQGRILTSAKYHGTEGEISDLLGKIATLDSHHVSELPDEDFAFVWKDSTGRADRRLPLRNALEVKAAAEYLQKYRDEFVYNDRQKIASRILVKAGEYGAGLGDLDTFLEKQAGYGVCAVTTAAEFLRTRAKIVDNDEISAQLVKTAETIESNPAQVRDSDQLQKLASLVDQIDHEYGIVREYSDQIKRPEDVFFTVTHKAASEFAAEHVPMTSGTIYKRADLRNLNLQQVRDWMGTDFADEVSAGGLYVDMEKLSEVLPTLPRSDAETFDRLLSDAGIEPFAKEAAQEQQGLTKQDLFSLAASYEPQV